MIYLLLWLLFGSICLNIMWMFRHKQNNTDMKLLHYLKGQLFGLLLGPVMLIFIVLLGIKVRRIK